MPPTQRDFDFETAKQATEAAKQETARLQTAYEVEKQKTIDKENRMKAGNHSKNNSIIRMSYSHGCLDKALFSFVPW